MSLTHEEANLIAAALKFDDERNGVDVTHDARPDLADAALAYRMSQLPKLPDRWARVYRTHAANPSWSDPEEAAEPQQGKHVAIVRYVAVPGSVRFVGGES